MAVVGFREVSGRTLSHRFGEPPSAERKFIVTLDSTAHTVAEVAGTIGIFHGAPHPEYGFLTMTEAVMTEGRPTPYHAEVTFRYELLKPDARDPNPLARPDTWSFSTGGAAVPALFYFDGNVQKPLVTAAGDWFEGITTEEAECRAMITANRPLFPLDVAVAVTNTISANPYLGAPKHHWKCVGISGQQQVEMVNDAEVIYWQITSELVYRQTGWILPLPHVGWNYLENGKKKKAWVLFRDETGAEVPIPAVNPQALNADGTLKPEGVLPDILERRVNRETDFKQFFGTPAWL
jgi:hypothetical protein